jgi:transcriptional regulator with XRE-family HTH domain
MQVVTYNSLVGYELEKLRKAQGLDQAMVSGKTGISQPVLSRLEKGKASITVDQLFVICSALGQRPQVVVDRVYQSVNAIQRENSVQLTTNKEVDVSTGALLSGAALGAVLTLLLTRKG